MRLAFQLSGIVLGFLLSTFSYSEWAKYPSELPQFDYSGDKLQKHWPALTSSTNFIWPDANHLRELERAHPKLAQLTAELAKKEDAPAALKAVLQNDYQSLSLAIQQVWRLHFQGQFEEAYTLGLTLGPPAYTPALYAKLIYTTHLVTDPIQKSALFLEVNDAISQISPLANDYSFLTFGDIYQKARRLELMSTSTAATSGLLSPTLETLRELHNLQPENPLYSAVLVGVEAGIIERIGNFLSSLTYGTDEDESMQLFADTLKSNPHSAVLHNEYALVMLRFNDDDSNELFISTLNNCTQLMVVSAEEALNQKSCLTLLQ